MFSVLNEGQHELIDIKVFHHVRAYSRLYTFLKISGGNNVTVKERIIILN